MSATSFVIFVDPAGGHRVAAAGGGAPATTIAAGPGATPAQIADAAAEALAAAGYGGGGGVLLALPSAWCLCAAIPTDGLPAKGLRQAMLYRLEEKLPVSAEDVVADFIPAGDRALGVAVERRAVAPLVDALERRGVAVEAVCPAALLALQRLVGDRPDVGDAHAVAWPAGESLDLFDLRNGVPQSWSVLAADEPKDLLLHLGLAAFDRPATAGPLKAVGIGLAAPARDALARLPSVRLVDLPPEFPDAPAAAMAGDVLAGVAAPWVDLRRDALAATDRLRLVRAPLTVAAAAVVLCLLSACAAMLWRAHRYDRLAAKYEAEQRAVFRGVFPRGAEPPDVRSRLASEERNLRGLSGDPSGGGTPAAGLPRESAGLLALRDLLANLPADVRYRILEVRVDPNRFAVDGQALTHGDADAIAEALRRGGLTVEPPRTEQLPAPAGEAGDGSAAAAVSFTITGEFAPAAGGSAPAGERRASR